MSTGGVGSVVLERGVVRRVTARIVGAPEPGVPLVLAYDRGRFSSDTIARMAGHLQGLLRAIAADPDTLRLEKGYCLAGNEFEGGRTPTGLDAVQWARMACEMGAGEILLTSMDADGTTDGYDLDLTRAVSDAVPVPVIASGGAGTPDHLADAVDPERGGAQAALAASVFHFGTFTVAAAKEALAKRGLPVRLADS